MARTTLIFGESGTFKTTNLGFAARYVYEQTGKPVRYVSADGGGWQPIQDLVDAGIIIPLNVALVRHPLTVFRKLAYGAWPEIENDQIRIYQEGGKIRTSWIEPPQSLAGVGGYVVETINSMGDILLEWFRDKQLNFGMPRHAAYVDKDESGSEEKFGSNTQDDYGTVQRELVRLLIQFGGLPVDRVLFSSHEARGEEKDTNKTIRGPAAVGQAITDRLPEKVGECIHFERYNSLMEVGQGRDATRYSIPKVKAFFASHPDPTYPKVMYKCKARIPPAGIAPMMERWPGGFFEPTPEKGLDEFLRFGDEFTAQSAQKYRDQAKVDKFPPSGAQKTPAGSDAGEQK